MLGKNSGIKRFGALILGFVLACSLSVGSHAADVSGWASGEIKKAEFEGLVTNNIRGKMKYQITRGEFCDLVMLMMEKYFPGISKTAEVEDNTKFYDTDSSNVKTAKYLGIVSGAGNGIFAPGRTISRGEMGAMLARAADIVYKKSDNKSDEIQRFLNTSEGKMLASWQKNGLKRMIELNILKGDAGKYFPDRKITGEEAVIMIYRFFTADAEKNFSEEELRSIENIRKNELTKFMPAHKESSAYAVNPSKSQSRAGSLSSVTVENGLKGINYMRYLAKVPHDITDSKELNELAQNAAFVLSVTNQFTHYPKNTENIPDEIFSKAYKGASTANIGEGYGETADSLYEFNIECLDDSDKENISKLGHRRWMLNPNLKFVGQGLAKNRVVTEIFDQSRVMGALPEYVTWPAKGEFPIRKRLNLDNIAWNISFSKKNGNISEANVILKNLETGKTWEFNNKSGKKDGEFYVNNGNYGYGPSVIFKPYNIKIENGHAYEVNFEVVQGGELKQEKYRIRFFK